MIPRCLFASLLLSAFQAQSVLNKVSGPTEALPVVVVSTRHVPADEAARAAFNEAQLAASEYMMNNFKSTDWEEVTLVHDVQWWESIDSFMLHVDPNNPDMQDVLNDWVPKYDLSIPFEGHVFGGWNEELRNITVPQ